MLRDEIKHIKSTVRDLQNFGRLVGCILLLVGAWFAYSARHAWEPVAIIGALLVALGFLWPQGLRQVYRGWMIFGLLLGWVMSRIVLSTLFFCVMTPLGFLMRLVGQRPLDLRFKPRERATTYWRYREEKRSTRERLERQF